MNEFRIEGPAVISFSGGRTSGYMLRRILDAHGGSLPENIHVVFANTGKERDETLAFVHAVETEWAVHVRWLEFQVEKPRVREVNFATASRQGEPFDALIRWKKRLPNGLLRICTQYLKVEAIQTFATGTLGLSAWTSVMGIRHDEPRRWRVIGQDPKSPHVLRVAPLVDAGVSKHDVLAYWATAPFDLDLGPDNSNCDLCFLKGILKREAVIRHEPERAEWWALAEERIGHVFRRDTPNYRQLQRLALRQPILMDVDPTDLGECFCHD